MKFPKCLLDEMQEKKSAKLEHIGLIGTMVALLLAVLIQIIVNMDFQCILGEFIVLEALCIYIAVSHLKCGISGRHIKHSIKNHLILSLIAAGIECTMICLTAVLQGYTEGILKDAAIWSGVTFAVCFLVVTLDGYIYKKRRQKLDSGAEYEELAKTVGVTVQTLKAIEDGSYNPSITLCRAICKAKGKTLDELFGEAV